MNPDHNRTSPLTEGLPRSWAWAVLTLVLAVQAWTLATHFEPVYAGPDAPGYFFNARLLATEGTGAWRPSAPAEWLVLHYMDGGDGLFRSRYPPGFPLMLAGVHRVGGPAAALGLNSALLVLSTLLLFLLARRWVGDALGLLAAGTLATIPALVEHAFLGFAHVPVLTLFLLGLLLLDRWLARPTPATGLFAGLSLGAMPAVRYGAVALGVGVVALLVDWATTHPANRRKLLWPVLGALVPLGALGLHQEIVYGSPLSTGYGATGEASAFGLGFVEENWLGYWRALMSNAGAITVLGLMGIASMVASRKDRGRGVLLAGSFVAAFGLYLSYYWTIQDFRFLVPTLPLLILGAVHLVHQAAEPRLRMALGATFLGMHLASAVPDAGARLRRTGVDLDRARAAVSAMERVAEPGSVVAGPLALNMILAYGGRWRLAEPSLLSVGPPPPLPSAVPPPFDETGKPQPSPIQPGRGALLRSKYAELTAADRSRAVLRDLLRWSANGRVYWINPGPSRAGTEAVYAEMGHFDFVEEVVLPAIPQAAHGFGSPGPDGTPQFWILPDTLRVYAFEAVEPAGP
jgi:4-amino-4-deoxy-L-arabinose transferase-like glycosyltransferase